jgi:hypothetical protein
MSERQRHAKIANEMADRLQRKADVPRWPTPGWVACPIPPGGSGWPDDRPDSDSK